MRDIVGRASCALDLSVVRGADAIVEVQRSEGLCECRFPTDFPTDPDNQARFSPLWTVAHDATCAAPPPHFPAACVAACCTGTGELPPCVLQKVGSWSPPL